MLNIEKYREGISVIYGANFGLHKDTEEFIQCITYNCTNCLFYRDDNKYCGKRKMNWLLEEYVEPQKLTKREMAFCEFAQTGWLARDSTGYIYFHKELPIKGIYDWNTDFYGDRLSDIIRTEHVFNFIKWEDDKPYSIEELLKLDVEEE